MSNWYDDHVSEVFPRYESVDSDNVHRSWLHLLDGRSAGTACDIGAGSGRDARWLAGQGWQVVAVEPSAAMRQRAEPTCAGLPVTWLEDALPELPRLRARGAQFDLIILSAVWQHIPPRDRARAFAVLCEQLRSDGLLVISLRQGQDATENRARGFHPVSAEELCELAAGHGLQLLSLQTVPDARRRDLDWEMVAFGAGDVAPAPA